MKKDKKNPRLLMGLAILLTIYLLSSCVSIPKKHSLSSKTVGVKDDKIYIDGKLFAELRYGLLQEKKLNGKTVLAPEYYDFKTFSEKKGKHYTDIYVRGFAIYYVKENTLVRIWPLDGNLEVRYTGGAFNIKISEDGKFINFTEHGVLWNSSHQYYVEYEVLD